MSQTLSHGVSALNRVYHILSCGENATANLKFMAPVLNADSNLLCVAYVLHAHSSWLECGVHTN